MTTRLHDICQSMEAKWNGRWGRGYTLQPHSLGTGDKCPPPTQPKFLSLVWDWEGAQKCFILHDQTTGDLKSHYLQAWATLPHSQRCLYPPPPPPPPHGFYNTLPYILAISDNARKKFLGHSRPLHLQGGGGRRSG